MNTGTLDALLLATFLFFVAGFVYFVAVGTHYQERALPAREARVRSSRSWPLGALTVVFLVRLVS